MIIRRPVAATTTESSPRQRRASLPDFCHFHGMLCAPSTARQCIDDFTGTVLFMPYDYYAHQSHQSLKSFDCSGNALNMVSYYGLVLFSMTGLWTLWGRTKFLVGRDETKQGSDNDDNVVSATADNKSSSSTCLVAETNPELVVRPVVWDYLHEQNPTSTQFTLQRRFEYDFSGLLTVVMLHLSCDQGKLHLVEVYKVENPIVRRLARAVFATMGFFVQTWGRWTQKKVVTSESQQSAIKSL